MKIFIAALLFMFAALPAGALDLPAWDSLPAEPAARAAALRAAVERVQADEGGQLSAASDCAAYAQIWLEKLNGGAGYRLLYAETSGVGDVRLADGRSLRRDKTHYFLADRTLCRGGGSCGEEIIIDPTYAQFLEPGECLYGAEGDYCAGVEELRGLPRVLVGTRAEVEAFYARLAPRLRLYTPSGQDPLAGKYEAASAVSLIYSWGPNAGLRGNIEVALPGRAGEAALH